MPRQPQDSQGEHQEIHHIGDTQVNCSSGVPTSQVSGSAAIEESATQPWVPGAGIGSFIEIIGFGI